MKTDKYNPDIHHRRSIRLKGYDYSRSGLYFITLCVVDRICVFGNIVDGKMQLNDIGRLVEEEWLNTVDVRNGDVRLHNYIVMPNHFHAIIEICECRGELHSPQILNTDNVGEYAMGECECRGESYSPQILNTDNVGECEKGECDSPLRMKSPSKTVGAIVRGFKGAVSRQLGYSVWQRNYYEHIIRTGESYRQISDYIVNNPTKWQDDKFYIP
jgi:REP element-mobilizing transposase RayT